MAPQLPRQDLRRWGNSLGVRLPAAIAREARLLTPPRPSAAWVPDRGEVIWIDHNPQAGREIKDHHPFLVLSTAPFHASVGLVVGCAMTSARGARPHPMGSLSNNRLELVREIVGQILGGEPHWRLRTTWWVPPRSLARRQGISAGQVVSRLVDSCWWHERQAIPIHFTHTTLQPMPPSPCSASLTRST